LYQKIQNALISTAVTTAVPSVRIIRPGRPL
jgi:hypothetical protein